MQVASQWIHMSFDHADSEGFIFLVLSSPEAGLWLSSSFPSPGVPWALSEVTDGDLTLTFEC